ncbi:MAG TPA: hypothetical protein VLS48_05400 [Anaerolineales bacterium]|nr:hypothetical protein [Anaerolineales bacterium]
MLDDLRKEADRSSYFEDDGLEAFDDQPSRKAGNFLGLLPFQRFILAVMFLIVTFLLSSFCLLATNRMALPFL